MKRFLVILLTTAMLLNCIITVSAVESESSPLCELYGIEFAGTSAGVIRGRQLVKSGATVSLDGIGKSSYTVQSDENGRFEIAFSYEAKKYTAVLRVDDAKVLETEVDFSAIPELFTATAGYTLKRIECVKSGIFVCATTEKTDTGVVFKAVEKGGDASSPANIRAAVQTKSDANGEFELSFALESGDYTAYLRAGDGEKISRDFSVKGLCDVLTEGFLKVDFDNFAALKAKVTGYAAELSRRIDGCENRGIAADYEKLNLSVIDKFASYMTDEAEHNDFSRMSEYYETLTALYEEAMSNLSAYENGEKEALRVPKFKTGTVSTNGTTVSATTFDGETEAERPVFFVGYGHWNTPQEELEFFPSIGTNIIQAQIDGSVLVKAAENQVLGADATEAERLAAEYGWAIDYTCINKFKAMLERAAENNIMVSLNLHASVPSFITDGDSTMLEGASQFIGFNVSHETARKAVEIRAKAVLDEIKDCAALYDVCLTNEPAVVVKNTLYFKQKWCEYLEVKYGTIDELKSVYGNTEYNSFADVTMPEAVESTPLFYDWREFNDLQFADFHNWYADVVKNIAPNVKVECKIMQYLDYNYKEDLRFGSDYEKIAESMDLNGCDAAAYYNVKKQPLLFKMAWYDFMTSVKDAPVWNTEDHLCGDGNTNTIDKSEKILYHSSADIWNGAVHGRGASVIWIWDKSDASMPWAEENGGWSHDNQSANFAMRPKEVARIGKTTLDLNRLSNEITAIQKAEPKVGILYSRISSGYSDLHMESLAQAYEEVLYSGLKAGFITDSAPNTMNNYELVVIPDASNVSENTLDALSEYLDNGGEVLIADTAKLLSKTALTKDEHNKDHDSKKVKAVYEHKNTEVIKRNFAEKLASALDEADLAEVVLTDTATGKKVEGVEWSYAEYDGDVVVNVMNYDWDNTREISIMYKNEKVEIMDEMRSNERHNGTVKVEPYSPLLLKFDNPEAIHIDLKDESGNVTESDISTLKGGIASLRSATEGDKILALYKDGVLEKVGMTGELEIPETVSEGYKLKAMIWDTAAMRPIVPSVSIECK